MSARAETPEEGGAFWGGVEQGQAEVEGGRLGCSLEPPGPRFKAAAAVRKGCRKGILHLHLTARLLQSQGAAIQLHPTAPKDQATRRLPTTREGRLQEHDDSGGRDASAAAGR